MLQRLSFRSPPSIFLAVQALLAPALAQDDKLSKQELDQLLAPIALHPDDLLTNVLMASTYPLDVVQAARWRKEPATPSSRRRADESARSQGLGPEHQGAGAVSKRAAEHERQARLDAEARRRLPRAAGRGDGSDPVPASEGRPGRQPQKQQAAEGLEENPATMAIPSTSSSRPSRMSSTCRTISRPSSLRAVVVRRLSALTIGPIPAPHYVNGYWWGAGIAIAGGIWGWNHFDWHRHNIDIDVNKWNNINVRDRNQDHGWQMASTSARSPGTGPLQEQGRSRQVREGRLVRAPSG